MTLDTIKITIKQFKYYIKKYCIKILIKLKNNFYVLLKLIMLIIYKKFVKEEKPTFKEEVINKYIPSIKRFIDMVRLASEFLKLNPILYDISMLILNNLYKAVVLVYVVEFFFKYILNLIVSIYRLMIHIYKFIGYIYHLIQYILILIIKINIIEFMRLPGPALFVTIGNK